MSKDSRGGGGGGAAGRGDSSNSSSQASLGDRDPRNISALLTSVDAAKVKRQTVASACEACRRTKTKCDGQRPCARCSRQNRECVYTVNPNETHQQAVKRKYDDLLRSHNELHELFQVIASTNENIAEEIMRQLRSGRPADVILQQHRRSQAASDDSLTHSYEQRLRQSFLLALTGSTAPLTTIVHLAKTVLSPKSRFNLPPLDAWEPLKHRIITLEILSGVVTDANKDPRTITSGLESELWEDQTYDDRINWVPAAPWVSLPDGAFSHLVSAFLSISNTYWRIVEADLFLQAVRSKDPDSKYCSPFLANTILALSSLFCEIDEAFAVPGDFLSRGEQYYNEAIRLWSLEQGRVSLTNIQGLVVLTIVCGLRGQDRLGATFLSWAFTMNESLPGPEGANHRGRESADYTRARRCLAETVWFIDSTVYALGAFRPALARPELLPSTAALDIVLPDSIRHWSPFPFDGPPIPVRINMLTRYRARLTRYACEFTHLFFSEKDKATALFLWQTAQPLAARIRDWYEGLPADFQYTGNAPLWMFEFHGQYYCLMMTIYSKCAEAFLAGDTAQTTGNAYDGLTGELYDASLQYAFRGATAARDFRERYGLKIIPPFLLQQCAVASFALLHELKRHPIDPAAPSQDGIYPITDSQTAFEECFRCLLGAGLQCLIPRAISRAIYNTAMVMKVRLPRAVVQMLKVVGSTAWRASDINLLNTNYPTWTLMREVDNWTDDDKMEDILRKWEELNIGESLLLDKAENYEDSTSTGGSSPAET